MTDQRDKNILYHVVNGVELEILNYKSDYVGIRYAKANGYYYLYGNIHITYEGGSTGKSLESCKLILKPVEEIDPKINPTLNILGDNKDWDINSLPYDFIEYCKENHYNIFKLPEELITAKAEEGLKDYFEEYDKWEISFNCGECGAMDKEDFIYNRTVANGEVWTCKNCNTETVVNEEPNEDNF